MCGIVGAIAGRDVVPVLIEGLKRLEYRGYDSSGIAVLDGAQVRRVRRTGRVAEMAQAAQAEQFGATLGIGHTRWATHGGVTEANAHPHISAGVALVHNGIIENHEEQRENCARLATPSSRRPTPKSSRTSSITIWAALATCLPRCSAPSRNLPVPTHWQ